jgi:hypothetical protein
MKNKPKRNKTKSVSVLGKQKQSVYTDRPSKLVRGSNESRRRLRG